MDTHNQPISGAGDSQESRIRELAGLLLRNIWFVVLTSLAITALVGVFTFNKPPSCEGTTSVLINIKAGREATLFSPNEEGSADKLANQMGILRSYDLAHRVADNLLAKPYADSAHTGLLPIVLRDPGVPSSTATAQPDEITERVQRAVSFSPEKESDIIRITATSTSTREAALLANVYAETYQDQIIQQSRSRSRSVREFLEGRLSEQRTTLQKAEAGLKELMESSGVVSLDGNSRQVVEELSQLEATRNGLSIEIQGLAKKLNTLQSQLPEQESSAANAIGQASDPYIKLVGEQLARLEVQRDAIIAQNDPAVLGQGVNQQKLKEISDQIGTLRENLRKRTHEMIWGEHGAGTGGTQADPLDYVRQIRQQLLEANVQLETLRSRRAAMNAIIADYEAKFRKIPRQSMDLARAQRERLSDEKLYGLVEEKYNEAAITEKSDFGYVDIIDRAAPQSVKVRSPFLLDTILGLLFGLVLTTSGVIAREKFDVRVRTPEQLLRNGYTSLAEISDAEKELHKLKANGHVPKEAQSLAPRLQLIYDPLSFTAECYRRLHSSLIRLQMDQTMKSVLFTSANPEEGKSTTLLNLALSLAETDQRVLVIDGDLRRPAVHGLLGLAQSPGLSDVVAGSSGIDDAIHHDVVPHLDVLTCGTAVEHPSSFFRRKRTVASLAGLRDAYAWILVDAPPLLVVDDAAVLSAVTDGTIIVVETGATRLEALKRTAKFIEKAGGKILGVVVNRFDPKSAYGGYYGSDRYGHYDKRHSYYHAVPGNAQKI